MSKGTKIRGIRIDDDLWEAATKRAKELKRESLSEVIREFLRGYVK